MSIHSKILFYLAAALCYCLDDNVALASHPVTDDEAQEEDTLQIPSVWPTPWTVLAIVLSVLQVALVVWAIMFMYAIVSSSKVRSVPYNIYLVFLVLPDAMLNLVGAVVPLVRTFAGESAAMIYILIWTSVFYYTSNFWLNFTIAYEIHKLVKQTYQVTLQTRKSSTSTNTEPAGPSLRKVYKQCLGLYFIAILAGTWFALPVPWSPMHVGGDGSQLAKFGSPPGGVFTSMMGFLIVVIFIMLVPTVYVLYVRFNLWRRQLLPKIGKTRVLSLYFMRILIVFFGFYYPSIIVSLIRSRSRSETFWFASSAFKRILEIAQASTTIYIASRKEDVKMAFYEAAGFCCKKRREALSSENINNDEVISENHISEWHDDDVYDDEQRKNARINKQTEKDEEEDDQNYML